MSLLPLFRNSGEDVDDAADEDVELTRQEETQKRFLEVPEHAMHPGANSTYREVPGESDGPAASQMDSSQMDWKQWCKWWWISRTDEDRFVWTFQGAVQFAEKFGDRKPKPGDTVSKEELSLLCEAYPGNSPGYTEETLQTQQYIVKDTQEKLSLPKDTYTFWLLIYEGVLDHPNEWKNPCARCFALAFSPFLASVVFCLQVGILMLYPVEDTITYASTPVRNAQYGAAVYLLAALMPDLRGAVMLLQFAKHKFGDMLLHETLCENCQDWRANCDFVRKLSGWYLLAVALVAAFMEMFVVGFVVFIGSQQIAIQKNFLDVVLKATAMTFIAKIDDVLMVAIQALLGFTDDSHFPTTSFKFSWKTEAGPVYIKRRVGIIAVIISSIFLLFSCWPVYEMIAAQDLFGVAGVGVGCRLPMVKIESHSVCERASQFIKESPQRLGVQVDIEHIDKCPSEQKCQCQYITLYNRTARYRSYPFFSQEDNCQIRTGGAWDDWDEAKARDEFRNAYEYKYGKGASGVEEHVDARVAAIKMRARCFDEVADSKWSYWGFFMFKSPVGTPGSAPPPPFLGIFPVPEALPTDTMICHRNKGNLQITTTTTTAPAMEGVPDPTALAEKVTDMSKNEIKVKDCQDYFNEGKHSHLIVDPNDDAVASWKKDLKFSPLIVPFANAMCSIGKGDSDGQAGEAWILKIDGSLPKAYDKGVTVRQATCGDFAYCNKSEKIRKENSNSMVFTDDTCCEACQGAYARGYDLANDLCKGDHPDDYNRNRKDPQCCQATCKGGGLQFCKGGSCHSCETFAEFQHNNLMCKHKEEKDKDENGLFADQVCEECGECWAPPRTTTPGAVSYEELMALKRSVDFRIATLTRIVDKSITGQDSSLKYGSGVPNMLEAADHNANLATHLHKPTPAPPAPTPAPTTSSWTYGGVVQSLQSATALSTTSSNVQSRK
jgi:hypothetical protein